jgi:hypothetical protein
MKPVLIDRSLVNTDFADPRPPKRPNDGHSAQKELFLYVCSLAEAGASYVELDFKSLIRLPKPSGAENYIYRLTAPEEFVMANALNFAYAVLPLKFAYVRSRLELPVILEIDVGDASDPMAVFNILQLISTNMDLTQFQMLRLTGDFDSATVPAIASVYRRRTVIPLDICPRNGSLTALDSAIAAYRANYDAVTVSFGDNDNFATLEEMLIMLGSMYRIFVSGTYLEGICKASLFSSMFALHKRTNLSLMMSKYMHTPTSIEKIDTPFCPKAAADKPKRAAPKVREKPPFKNTRGLMTRVVNSMGLAEETSDEIMKILDSCNIDFAKTKAAFQEGACSSEGVLAEAVTKSIKKKEGDK